MKRLLCHLSIIPVLFFTTYHLAFAQCDNTFNHGMQKLIDEVRMKYDIAGMQVSIICPGDSEPRDFVSGTTTINGTVPIQSTTLFQIGSETKSFTAAIILQLASEGKLSLDDPINKWYKFPNSWKNITIRQLLNHTSGLIDYSHTDTFQSIEYATNGQIEWQPETLLLFVAFSPLQFEPGHGYFYSNTNFLIAGMIIKAVTGHEVADEMKARLIDPLHLTNTYHLPHAYSSDILQRMSHGYLKLLDQQPVDIINYNMSFAGAAGANVSTSHDTAIWFKNLLTGVVLSPKELKELTSWVDMKNGQSIPNENKNDGYGLGIMHDYRFAGEEVIYHPGQTIGYSAVMAWLKCRNIFVTSIINDYYYGMDSAALMKDIFTYIQENDSEKNCPVDQQIKKTPVNFIVK